MKLDKYTKKLFDKDTKEKYEVEEENFVSINQYQRSCVHEAGHFVCATLLGIGIEEVVISPIGSFVALEIEGRDSEEDLRKLIGIMYGGYLAEKIIFKTASSGFMGAEDADMESANEMLREYIILSDNELSLTGLEEELIKEKMIKLSKEIEKETFNLLKSNVNMLVEIANKFIDENRKLLDLKVDKNKK